MAEDESLQFPVGEPQRPGLNPTRQERRKQLTRSMGEDLEALVCHRFNLDQETAAKIIPGVAAQGSRWALSEQFKCTKLCPYHKEGICWKGAKCTFAHQESQLRTAPDLYKTKLCLSWRSGFCNNGDKCSFAHGRGELRSTTEVYKSRLCHFWLHGECNKGVRCRHAHGLDELPPELRGYFEKVQNQAQELQKRNRAYPVDSNGFRQVTTEHSIAYTTAAPSSLSPVLQPPAVAPAMAAAGTVPAFNPHNHSLLVALQQLRGESADAFKLFEPTSFDSSNVFDPGAFENRSGSLESSKEYERAATVEPVRAAFSADDAGSLAELLNLGRSPTDSVTQILQAVQRQLTNDHQTIEVSTQGSTTPFVPQPAAVPATSPQPIFATHPQILPLGFHGGCSPPFQLTPVQGFAIPGGMSPPIPGSASPPVMVSLPTPLYPLQLEQQAPSGSPRSFQAFSSLTPLYVTNPIHLVTQQPRQN